MRFHEDMKYNSIFATVMLVALLLGCCGCCGIMSVLLVLCGGH